MASGRLSMCRNRGMMCGILRCPGRAGKRLSMQGEMGPTFIPPVSACTVYHTWTDPPVAPQRESDGHPDARMRVYLVHAPRGPHGNDHSLETDRHSAEPRCLPDLASTRVGSCGRCVRHVRTNRLLGRRQGKLANEEVRVGSGPHCVKSLPFPSRARAGRPPVWWGVGGDRTGLIP